MTDLTTSYMGIPLTSPLVVAASSISSMIDRVRLAEQAGAGALVIRSLFEEQIQLDALHLKENVRVGGESYAEAESYFPEVRPGAGEEHLHWIEKTRAAVKMPLIASLNATSPGSWVHYARQLEGTGVSGLELNLYAVPGDPRRDAPQIERELLDIVAAVRAETRLPLAVKLSPFYTSLGHLAQGLDRAGVDALVLFNRFRNPTSIRRRDGPIRNDPIDAGRAALSVALDSVLRTDSGANCTRTPRPFRFRRSQGAVGGGQVVQTASALLQHGIPYLSTMLRQLEGWMGDHGYSQLDDFRGRLSQRESPDPFAYERAQYVRLLSSQK
jgi:dihydroorotate dehydrogenase (fumarate)